MIDVSKKRILVLIANFLPGYKMGGPLTSVLNIINVLSDDYFFEVLTSDRDIGDENPYDEIETNKWIHSINYSVYYLKNELFCLFKFVRIINASSAEILYLNSLFSPIFTVFVLFAHKFGLIKNKKIILAPRGETYDEALAFKSFKKKLFLTVCKKLNLFSAINFHASTDIEKDSIVRNLNISEANIHVAFNLSKIKKQTRVKSNLVSFEKLPNVLYLVFLSRISKDKNIVYTFDILKKVKSIVVFDIYGPIEDLYIWETCQQKIAELPNNITVNYRGAVSKKEVINVFSNYDLMFLPTFAENFGHVIVESLSAGTPVLISDRTPWRYLQEKGFGWDLSLSEPTKFAETIEHCANLTTEEKKVIRLGIINNISKFTEDPAIIEANKNLFKISLIN